MAIQIICDGCGVPEKDGQHKKIGAITPGHYCVKCEKDIDAYIAERDALHDACAQKWKTGIAKIVKKHGEKLRLPDAPA